MAITRSIGPRKMMEKNNVMGCSELNANVNPVRSI